MALMTFETSMTLGYKRLRAFLYIFVIFAPHKHNIAFLLLNKSKTYTLYMKLKIAHSRGADQLRQSLVVETLNCLAYPWNMM